MSGAPGSTVTGAPNKIDPRLLALCAARPRRRPAWRCNGADGSRHALQPPDRKAGDQVLRLHAQHLIRRHRQDQVDRIGPRIFGSASAGSRTQPKQPNDAGARRIVERPRRATARRQSACRRVKPDIPVKVTSLASMSGSMRPRRPSRCAMKRSKDLARRRKSTPTRGEIKSHVERIAALPVALGVVVAENVDVDRTLQSRASKPAATRGRAWYRQCVSSSAASSAPSCNGHALGRNKSSAALSTNGSSQPSSALRKITWTN